MRIFFSFLIASFLITSCSVDESSDKSKNEEAKTSETEVIPARKIEEFFYDGENGESQSMRLEWINEDSVLFDVTYQHMECNGSFMGIGVNYMSGESVKIAGIETAPVDVYEYQDLRSKYNVYLRIEKENRELAMFTLFRKEGFQSMNNCVPISDKWMTVPGFFD